jgi:hypothetical protein
VSFFIRVIENGRAEAAAEEDCTGGGGVAFSAGGEEFWNAPLAWYVGAAVGGAGESVISFQVYREEEVQLQEF